MKKIGKIILTIVAIGIMASIFTQKKETTSVSTNQTVKSNEVHQTSQETTQKSSYELTEVKQESDAISTSVTGILKNNTSSKKSYVQIKFTVKDKDGNKVGEAFANISGLDANGTWKFKAMYFGSEKDVTVDLENPEVTGL